MESLDFVKNKICALKNYIAKNINNWFFLGAITFFMLYTVIIIFTRTPWYDEAHAWCIARDLNFFEYLKIARSEGHLFLWYLAISPFAKLNFHYPISMEILNFLFILPAIFILWKKSKLNPIAKTLINVSSPIFMYSVIARCYSLTILLISLVCFYHKKRFENSILYSVFLVLLANTCSMGIFFAFGFGLFYLVDLFLIFKNKTDDIKKYKIPLLILFSGVLIVLYQTFCFHVPFYAQKDNYTSIFKLIKYFKNGYTINLYLALILSLMSIIVFFKRKKLLVIFLFSEIALLLLFSFIYGGEPWHFNFVWIYFVAIFSLYKDEIEKLNWFDKTFEVIFTIFCGTLLFLPQTYNEYKALDKDFVFFIESAPYRYENKKFVIFPKFSYAHDIIPYLTKNGFDEVYNEKGELITSFEHYFKMYDTDWSINYKRLSELLEGEECIYIILLSENIVDLESFRGDFNKNHLDFGYVEHNSQIFIYKLFKI